MNLTQSRYHLHDHIPTIEIHIMKLSQVASIDSSLYLKELTNLDLGVILSVFLHDTLELRVGNQLDVFTLNVINASC